MADASPASPVSPTPSAERPAAMADASPASHVSPTPSAERPAASPPPPPLTLLGALRSLAPAMQRRVQLVLWLRVVKTERRFARRLLRFAGAGPRKDAELTPRRLVAAGSMQGSGEHHAEGQLVGIGPLCDAGSAQAGDAHTLLGLARVKQCVATPHRTFAAAAAAAHEHNGLSAEEAAARDAGEHALKPAQTLYRWEIDQDSIVRFSSPVVLPQVFGSFGTLPVALRGDQLAQLPAAFGGNLAVSAVPPKLTPKQQRQQQQRQQQQQQQQQHDG